MRLLLDIFGQTLRTLWSHKLRSFLTMFGIAWGVGSLLLLVGLGEGFRSGQKKNLSSMGQNIIWIFGGRIPTVQGSYTAMRPFNLTYNDYLALKRDAKLVKDISPVLQRTDIRAVGEVTSTNGEVFGIMPEYNLIRTIPVASGRWLNQQDEAEGRLVVVIGYEMRKNIFAGRNALGNTILLNGTRFTVIGVLDKIGREQNNGTNIRFFIPISVMRKLFPLRVQTEPGAISFINYQPPNRAEHDAAVEEVHRIVAQRHGLDWHDKEAFNEQDTLVAEQTVGKIFDAMDWFLGGVGIVTLALGAIGILNIMLVSVAERTSEIGLRKALGATNRSILTQFFLEGAFLTVLSGGIGFGFAAGLMSLLGGLPQPDGFDTPKLVPLSAAAATLALSAAGIAAGLYPARKAAMLTPVEAFRRE